MKSVLSTIRLVGQIACEALTEERAEKIRIAKAPSFSKAHDDKVLRSRNVNALAMRADHRYQV